MGLAGKYLATVLGGIHNQGTIAMVPIGRLFSIVVVLGMDLFAVCLRIEIQIEGILGTPDVNAIPGPRRAMRDTGLKVTRPCHLARTELAHIPRDDHDHRGPAAVGGAVEPVGHALAIVNAMRLDGA